VLTKVLYTIHFQALKAQQDRDEQVQQLWGTVIDTLDFMKELDPLGAIKGLEKTVQAIMKQIYDCTLFLRSYAERTFVGEYILLEICMDCTHDNC
jgi:hypothetical protein